MKKIFGLLAIFAIVFTACEGDPGPPGPEGPPGSETLATVFEENVTFSYDTDANLWFSPTLGYNGVVDGDVFIVYTQDEAGLWIPLPASFFNEEGELQYTFNHDASSVEIQIIGEYDLSGIDTFFTDNVPFRVAILPAELVAQFESTPSMSQLMSTLEMDTDDITIKERL